MEDSELAKENAQLRMRLLESAADNDAISRSLQERIASLADVTDAKLKAESETRVLQIQVKSMQKDMEAHKYELHLLRKQLQIRNDEREHNKKVSDATNKQHLDNVKKIARLESECQRLRALIRQRLPQPSIIAQMQLAECEMHSKTCKKKSLCLSTPSRPNLPNSSYLHHQREREALKERLLSVEDEAKFLKEALAKRTAELQEARQLCARTAMKLSSAQDRVEAMSMNMSMPSTLWPQTNMHLVTAWMQDGDKRECSSHVEHGAAGVHVSSIMHKGNMMPIDYEEVVSCDSIEVDEVSCAESWASALFAELSHLSHFHENAYVGTSKNECISSPKDKQGHSATAIGHAIRGANYGYKPDESIQLQELDLYSALHKVNQKLSHVGEGILLSSFTSDEDDRNVGTATFRVHPSDNTVDQNFNILDEISRIKHLLLELGRVMEMQGKLHCGSVNVINDDHDSINDVISVNQEGEISRTCRRERTLRRIHGQNGEKIDIKFSDGAKFSTATSANLEEFGDIIIGCSTEGAKFRSIGVKRFSQNAEVATSVDNFSSSLQINLAGKTIDVAADMDVHAILQAAQTELDILRGTVATLEGELSQLQQEKADLAEKLSATCSIKNNLETELAITLANVEQLKIQVFSVKSQLTDQTQDRDFINPLGGQPLNQVGNFNNLEEEQELAIARAQLANCQQNIHVMCKQMAPDILNSLSQDVITEESSFFDSSSQSSKSTSPNMVKKANSSPNIKNVNPIEQQEEDFSCCHSGSSTNANTLLKSSISHHHMEDKQSIDKFKVDHVDEDSQSCDLLTRCTSEDHEAKSTLAKSPTLLATSRIAEFFNKAKPSRCQTT